MNRKSFGKKHYAANLLVPILRAIENIGGSGLKGEIANKVIADQSFGDETLSIMMPDGKRREFDFCFGWALSHLKKLAALDNSRRGVWTITPKGRGLLTASAEVVWEAVLQAWREFDTSRREKAKSPIHKPVDPAGLEIDDSTESADAGWKADLLQTLHALGPEVFERLSQRILRESGFTKVEVLGKSGDGGLDGVGVLRVALLSFPVYFQCKRYKPSGSVPASEVRDFRGALAGRGEKGLFITTASFTSGARQEATRDGVIAVDLIDGDELCDLLSSLGLGVKKELVEQVTIDAEWFQSL